MGVGEIQCGKSGTTFLVSIRWPALTEFLRTWNFECSEEELDEHRTQQTLTYTDSETGLQVRCVLVVWNNYPTVEWTVYFKNNGDTNTPILSSIQAIDTAFDRGPDGEFVLHHHIGDKCTIDSFAPIERRLNPGTSKTFVPDGGRPSNGEWPYYNLECPDEGKGCHNCNRMAGAMEISICP